MKVLYCDCFAGLSGDMLLGSLIDAGASTDAIQQELAKLGLSQEYEFNVSKVIKKSFSATDVDIKLIPHVHHHGHEHHHHEEHSHSHDNHHGHIHHDHEESPHHHSHDTHHHLHENHNHSHNHVSHEHSHHGHQHQHEHDHAHMEESSHHHGTQEQVGHTHNRNLVDIVKIIDDSSLSEEIKVHAKYVFQRLAQAEAKVHGTTVDKVHFHEVGAVDAIVDICGTIIALHILGIEKIYCAPLPTGSGFVECAHGLIPVPAPATAELTKSIPTYDAGVTGELVTPTGAALITSLADSFGPRPTMKVGTIGYGAGKKDFGLPNVLRVFIGEEVNETKLPTHGDSVMILETTIDDCTPEILGYLWDRVFASGALDMFYTSVFMKKGRPAILLTVITTSEKMDAVSKTIFTETSTIGLRVISSPRICLEREITIVSTPLGNVRFKVSGSNAKPEFVDLQDIAQQKGLPLKEVHNIAIATYENTRKSL